MHDDRKEFADLIDGCNKRMMIGEALIEKDYYVTMFLKHLYEAEPNIVFKGGTCLSKCFKLIDRFSEDIDISMPPASSKRQKKNLKYYIVDVANELGLRHLNADMIRSGRSYAEHRVAFPAAFKSGKIDPVLLIETYFRPTALPTLTLPVSSFLHDHLKEKGAESA
ncbi:MAG: nucleotidyl transferase AbiEii/AbiGii toxin family protein, partial [Methanomassiliicoccaceae archaeon]|nr:nucleotidyl transferase AbiEii/AbiGii toxin family protein [Methanomassiliicoccaceae archaeon]